MSKIKIRVYHAYYGCESGCCGHIIETDSGIEQFVFSHPDSRQEAEELARDEIAKNHPACMDSIDWESLEFELSAC